MGEDCSDSRLVCRYNSHQLHSPSSPAIVRSEVSGSGLRIGSDTLKEDELDTGDLWARIRRTFLLAAEIKDGLDVGGEPRDGFWVTSCSIEHARAEDESRTNSTSRDSPEIANVEQRTSGNEGFAAESRVERHKGDRLSGMNARNGLELSTRK